MTPVLLAYLLLRQVFKYDKPDQIQLPMMPDVTLLSSLEGSSSSLFCFSVVINILSIEYVIFASDIASDSDS